MSCAAFEDMPSAGRIVQKLSKRLIVLVILLKRMSETGPDNSVMNLACEELKLEPECTLATKWHILVVLAKLML